MAAATLYTIGHSTHPAEQFASLLHANGVTQLADVRSIPKSRHCPQFHIEQIAQWLPQAGIEYRHFKDLGGRRSTRKSSPNTGWRNASFRGYADYMDTPAFTAALDQLVEYATAAPTAIMCAEAVPWRCHRSLISDAMLVRGWQVLDIISAAPAKPHKPTPFLKVVGGRLTYPGEQGELNLTAPPQDQI